MEKSPKSVCNTIYGNETLIKFEVRFYLCTPGETNCKKIPTDIIKAPKKNKLEVFLKNRKLQEKTAVVVHGFLHTPGVSWVKQLARKLMKRVCSRL